MIETHGDELVVIASTPDEMVASQHALIASVGEKIVRTEAAIAENKAILAATVKAKVNQTAAKRLLKLSEHRAMYLGKVKAALEAGYVMVPDMEGQILAIRVKRDRPEQGNRTSTTQFISGPTGELPDAIPAGVGEYVNPVPDSTALALFDNAGKQTGTRLRIEDFSDELALPTQFLKPTIIQRTGEAVELKIFDEIVAVYDGAQTYRRKAVKGGKGDPLIIVRIFDHGGGRKKFQRRATLAFLIAWFIDTSVI